ncbi:MAG: MOSC domain-containing protein [Bacillota bacterium]
MLIRYLSVGQPAKLPGTETVSAIRKEPVEGAVYLSRLGLAGDEQADLEHHGGPDKAVCLYAIENYPIWEKLFGHPLPPSAFGENLTVEGMPEESVLIGDIYRVGGALIQVCQPRVPCYKVNHKWGRTDVLPAMVENCRTGYYIRVLEEGPLQAGDRFELVERNSQAPSVLTASQIFHHQRKNREAMEQLASTPALAAVWVRALQNRIAAL